MTVKEQEMCYPPVINSKEDIVVLFSWSLSDLQLQFSI